jgi:tetratricopeptide (TPR) repeat protein
MPLGSWPTRRRSGRSDRALAEYEALTRRAPAPGFLLEYADLLSSVGRHDQARQQVELAAVAHRLFLANGGVDGITGALIAEALGQPRDAVSTAEAEWARRQHADVADALGWALHLDGRDREARGYAAVAYRTGARSALYAYHLGMIENSLGQSAAAATHLARAIDINAHFSPVDSPVAIRTLSTLESR